MEFQLELDFCREVIHKPSESNDRGSRVRYGGTLPSWRADTLSNCDEALVPQDSSSRPVTDSKILGIRVRLFCRPQPQKLKSHSTFDPSSHGKICRLGTVGNGRTTAASAASLAPCRGPSPQQRASRPGSQGL